MWEDGSVGGWKCGRMGVWEDGVWEDEVWEDGVWEAGDSMLPSSHTPFLDFTHPTNLYPRP